MSMIENLYKSLLSQFKDKNLSLSLPNTKCLAEITASMSINMTSNTAKIANSLIHNYTSKDNQERKVLRYLNKKFNNFNVWKNFIHDFEFDDTIVLSLDQSEIGHQYAILMISIRYQDRAIPLHWLVREGQANVGFHEYVDLLDEIHDFMQVNFKNRKIILMADRFYACTDLVSWLNDSDWDYRLRLKSNVDVLGYQTLNKFSDLENTKLFSVDNILIFNQTTNLSWLKEPGHKEGWAIISKQKSGKNTALDYGLRWGIESMFSDFKSRGFEINKTNIRKSSRLERMILLIALTFWILKEKKSNLQE